MVDQWLMAHDAQYAGSCEHEWCSSADFHRNTALHDKPEAEGPLFCMLKLPDAGKSAVTGVRTWNPQFDSLHFNSTQLNSIQIQGYPTRRPRMRMPSRSRSSFSRTIAATVERVGARNAYTSSRLNASAAAPAPVEPRSAGGHDHARCLQEACSCKQILQVVRGLLHGVTLQRPAERTC